MTKSTGIPKRWRLRFSLRTLVIFVTLVCVYFGAWEATKRFGVPAVSKFATTRQGMLVIRPTDATSRLPFCVHLQQLKVDTGTNDQFKFDVDEYERDYLWIFGWVIHLKDKKLPRNPGS